MRDPILQDEMMRQRERFVNSVDTEATCNLASSYHNGDSCKQFRHFIHGSFNVCFFVQFDQPTVLTCTSAKPDRLVVRIAILSHVSWVDEKLEADITIIRSDSPDRLPQYVVSSFSPSCDTDMLLRR